MAKKNRKQKQRAARRPAPQGGPRPVATAPRVAPSVSPSTAASSATLAEAADVDIKPVRAAAPAPAAVVDPTRRRVERVGPAALSAATLRQQRQAAHASRYTGSSAAAIGTLDTDDPGIPFDHVPYVPADLRRVAVIASVMVVLILIAWGVVSQVVH
jgi:hypothetical protein